MTEPKSMNFIRRLIRENFYFSNQSCQIWWQYERYEKYKMSVQHLLNGAG